MKRLFFQTTLNVGQTRGKSRFFLSNQEARQNTHIAYKPYFQELTDTQIYFSNPFVNKIIIY